MVKQWQLWGAYLSYFALITILRWQWEWPLIWLWVGGVIGLGFEFVDQMIYVYGIRPQDQLSQYVRHLIKEKQYREVVKVLTSRGGEQRHLVSRSVLFLWGWMAIAVYVITSTGSMLATGIVLGIGLRLAFETTADWQNKERLKERLFWQIKRPVSDRELKVVVGMFMVIFGLLSLAVI